MFTYAKYSDSADRWIVWDTETGTTSMFNRSTWQKKFNLTPKHEHYSRYGVTPGQRDEELIARYETPTYTLNSATGRIEASYVDAIDTSPVTNPALYWQGEASDAAAGRYYGRPVPASAGPLAKPA